MAVPTYDDFDSARAEIDKRPEAAVVCATLKDGEPKYFLAPADVSDEQIRDKAFEVREGRKPTSYERFLLEQAEAERARLSA